MYATHTTRSARFLQTSSCPDGLGQSCMPHAVHISFRPVRTGAIMYATHTTRSARFLQTSSCPDGLGQSCMPHTPHAVHVSFRPVRVQMDLRQSCMPHTPHAVHVSFRPVRVQMDWDWGNHVCHTHTTRSACFLQSSSVHLGYHVCHTHPMQCTFPSDQFVSRWTEAIMYATHTTCSARFLQSSSCPDGLGQSCMPHAVHVSFRPVLVQMDWGNHVCHTPHAVYTFPSEQFVSRWTEAIMYATHTTRSAHFLQTSSIVSRWTEAIMYVTHTTRSARFLQTNSCPDGLRQSCMPHTPHAVHVSFRAVRVQID